MAGFAPAKSFSFMMKGCVEMKMRWMKATAILLAVSMFAGCAAKGGEEPKEPSAPGAKKAKAAEIPAEIPDLPACPSEQDYVGQDGHLNYEEYEDALSKWYESMRARRADASDAAKLLTSFYEKTLPVFLGNENGENKVYSPLNVYLALAMLAEITDGETRAQLLAVLGSDDLETVREAAKLLWLSNYTSGDTVTCLLANSLWLNETVDFNEETLKTLATEHFASSFSGKCGSDEMNEKLRAWLDENTGGLLKEAVKGVEITPDTVIALASTIYFKGTWSNEFMKEATAERTFYAAAEETAEFMTQTEQMIYARGKNFTMVGLPMKEGGYMYLLLPDEGITPESLFADEEAMAAVREGQKGGWTRVRLVVPKFDVSSDMDLVEGFKELGVTDVFDVGKADFSPLSEDAQEDTAVTSIKHSCRVKTDEEGIEGAAFTLIMVDGAVMVPADPIEVVYDRPFGFVVAGTDGTMLFAGVVNSTAN